jgi:mannosyl-3-phosphoglycerate phosphatase
MTNPYIIFSDLDGTLLDHHTYSFKSALSALSQVKDEGIPLILVSSKTRQELIYYQKKLGLTGLPFVVENGSAIFTPIGFFNNLRKCEIIDEFDLCALGKTYDEIETVLEKISEKYHYIIQGFHNATQSEIKKLTGLSDDQLQMAISREFSIPLFFDDRADKILNKEMDNYGLKLLYGGRFMHLLSTIDKGEAMKIIMEGYRKREGRDDIHSVAIGDSLNDFAMLAAADHAILVKKPDGSYERRQTLENVIYSPGIGPEGWNQSIIQLIETGGSNE